MNRTISVEYTIGSDVVTLRVTPRRGNPYTVTTSQDALQRSAERRGARVWDDEDVIRTEGVRPVRVTVLTAIRGPDVVRATVTVRQGLESTVHNVEVSAARVGAFADDPNWTDADLARYLALVGGLQS